MNNFKKKENRVDFHSMRGLFPHSTKHKVQKLLRWTMSQKKKKKFQSDGFW